MTDSPSAKDRAQEAAGTAADEGRHLAGVAQEEAGNVASEAATQARQVVDQAMSQVNEQSKEQKDRLAGTLRSFGDDLESMTSQASPGLAADLTRQVSGYARAVSDHLSNREPGELLADVRRFARERPGTFLLGALAAGVVVGRLARGAADGIAGAAAVQQTGTGTAPSPSATSPSPTYSTTGATGTPTYPGAPAGQPFDPDPREIPDTHGHDTGIPAAPTTPASTSQPGGEDLR